MDTTPRWAMLPPCSRPASANWLLARAWLADPALLILDEATSSLDVATETRVTEAMRRLRQGRTTIVIAHRLSTVIEADQIAVIEDGRVVEVGPPDQLLTRGGNLPTSTAAGSPAPHDRAQTLPLVQDRRLPGPSGMAADNLARGQLASRVRLAGEDGPPVAGCGNVRIDPARSSARPSRWGCVIFAYNLQRMTVITGS